MKQISSGPTPTPFPSGGSPGQVLGLDGAGKLAWLTVTGGGGGGTPPGTVAYSQYRLNVTANSGGALLSVGELALLNAQGTNMAVGGTASASSTYNSNIAEYGPGRAFDGTGNTDWTTNGVPTGQLTYVLASPSVVTGYTMLPSAIGSGADRAPKTWTLEGSNDGSSWTLLHAVADAGAWTDGQSKTYTI